MMKSMLVVMMCMMLVACGGKPDGMSDDAYEIGENILEVTDQYLKVEIDEEEAYEKIMKLSYQIDFDMDNVKDADVSRCASAIMQAINDGKTNEVRAARDELKSLLNK